MCYREQLSPWVVYRLLPNLQSTAVARFRRRNDADEYVQALKRLTPGAKFIVAFKAKSTQPKA